MSVLNLPGIGGLVSELSGYQGKVLAHLDPQVGLRDAAVVGMDRMNTGHLSSNTSDKTRTNTS